MLYKLNEESFSPSSKLDGESEIKYEVKNSSAEDDAIEFIKFTQAMEGFEVTPEDETECRKILKGEISVQESVRQYIIKNGLESK